MMLNKSVKLIIATLLLTPVSSAFAALVTWDSGAGSNNHWYETILSTGVSRTDAKAIADAKGGYLVSITSQEEQDFIHDNILVFNSTTQLEGFAFWSGGYATNTDLNDLVNNGGSPGWAWDNGDVWGYENNNFSASADGNGIDEILNGAVASNEILPGVFTFFPDTDSELAPYVRVSAFEEFGVVEGFWSDLRDSGTQPTMEVDFLTGDILSPLTLVDRTGGFIIEYDSQPVPEPTTLGLLSLGMAGLAFTRRRRQIKT